MHHTMEVKKSFSDLKILNALGSSGKPEIVCISHGSVQMYLNLEIINSLSIDDDFTYKQDGNGPEILENLKCISIDGPDYSLRICIYKNIASDQEIIDWFNKLKHVWFVYKTDHSAFGMGNIPIGQS